MFKTLHCLAQLFPYILGSHLTEKDRNRWRNFFSSSGNTILSILLKYQRTDVQIQTFANED